MKDEIATTAPGSACALTEPQRAALLGILGTWDDMSLYPGDAMVLAALKYRLSVLEISPADALEAAIAARRAVGRASGAAGKASKPRQRVGSVARSAG